MLALKEKLFQIGTELVKMAIQISAEESRKEFVSQWIDEFNDDIRKSKDLKRVPVTVINRFQVSPIPEEVDAYLKALGYELRFEKDEECWYLIR